MTTTGDLIRGPRGAAALVIDKQEDGLHVVTVRGSAVWPDREYQPCEQPPMGLLRQATAKAETVTRTRDTVIEKVDKQRAQQDARKQKINREAIEAANNHGISGSVSTLLRKFGMEGAPRYLSGVVQARFRAEGTSRNLTAEMTYRAPWAYSNNDVTLIGTWSFNAAITALPGQRERLTLAPGADLNTDCPCDEIRAKATPDWAIGHFQTQVFGSTANWNVTVDDIGAIWVQDGSNSSLRCRHYPADRAINTFREYVPEPGKEVK
jgi:hypothetical protein